MATTGFAWCVLGACLAVRAAFLSAKHWRRGAWEAADLILVAVLAALWLGHRKDPLLVYGMTLTQSIPWLVTLAIGAALGISSNLISSGILRSGTHEGMKGYGAGWLPGAPGFVRRIAAPSFIAVHTLFEELAFRGLLLLDLVHAWPQYAWLWNLSQAVLFGILHGAPLLVQRKMSRSYIIGAFTYPTVAAAILGYFVLSTHSLWPGWALHILINMLAFYFGPRFAKPASPTTDAHEDGIALRVNDLSKRYRRGKTLVQALNGFSLAIKQGEIVGLLGPNGAGKTTAVKIICGLARADSGAVWLKNESGREAVGVLLEGNRTLIDRLTGRENLDYFAGLRGVLPTRKRRERVGKLLEQFGLATAADRIIAGYSRGMKQRLAIAVAMVTSPSLLILDEPTLGLDVEATEQLKTLLRSLALDGISILVTTHQMDLAQTLCDRVAIISNGRVAVADTPANLISLFSTERYVIKVEGQLGGEVLKVLGREKAVTAIASADSTCIYLQDAAGEIYRVLAHLQGLGVRLISVHREEPDLAEVYLAITRGEVPTDVVMDCAAGRI